MSKKLTSTIALMLIGIAFLWWGLSMVISGIQTLHTRSADGETIVYGLLILICSGYALVSLLMLPRRK